MRHRLLIGVAALVFCLAPAAARSQSAALPADVSGAWTVRWVSNDTRNPMSLSQASGKISGSYTNDSKEFCGVSGELAALSARLKLRISCPKWDIQMDGYLSRDGKIVVGTYLAYGDSRGGFLMSRR